MNYKKVLIPKGKGRFREIYIPSDQYKLELRALIPVLEMIHANLDTTNVNYAFQKRKNCAIKALQHISQHFTVSFDLRDFFDNVRIEHVKGKIPGHIIERCFIDGSLKQGLPTSPIVSNIAFIECDKKILSELKKSRVDVVYTRYADDLVFSFDNRKDLGKIAHIVKCVVESEGFSINQAKTRFQDSRNGRRIITGISVGTDNILPTRSTRRKIRAATHQRNTSSLLGLLEWAKCKLPIG